MSEREQQLWVTDGELGAKALIGKVTLFGGCPYRVTSVAPVNQLRWAVMGVPEPAHPEPADWKKSPFT